MGVLRRIVSTDTEPGEYSSIGSFPALLPRSPLSGWVGMVCMDGGSAGLVLSKILHGRSLDVSAQILGGRGGPAESALCTVLHPHSTAQQHRTASHPRTTAAQQPGRSACPTRLPPCLDVPPPPPTSLMELQTAGSGGAQASRPALPLPASIPAAQKNKKEYTETDGRAEKSNNSRERASR